MNNVFSTLRQLTGIKIEIIGKDQNIGRFSNLLGKVWQSWEKYNKFRKAS